MSGLIKVITKGPDVLDLVNSILGKRSNPLQFTFQRVDEKFGDEFPVLISSLGKTNESDILVINGSVLSNLKNPYTTHTFTATYHTYFHNGKAVFTDRCPKCKQKVDEFGLCVNCYGFCWWCKETATKKNQGTGYFVCNNCAQTHPGIYLPI